jgi:hypothetical protein
MSGSEGGKAGNNGHETLFSGEILQKKEIFS